MSTSFPPAPNAIAGAALIAEALIASAFDPTTVAQALLDPAVYPGLSAADLAAAMMAPQVVPNLTRDALAALLTATGHYTAAEVLAAVDARFPSSFQLGGALNPTSAVTFQGQPTYVLDKHFAKLTISGSLSVPASLQFSVLNPRWNAAQPDSNVVVWTTVNGQELVNLRVSNYQLGTAAWQTVGPIALGAGSFVVSLESGEGDGAAWPDPTDPFYLGGIQVSAVQGDSVR